MRNLNEATLYPGIGAIEGTNISVGRGTDTPFEQIGAPWIDGVQLADALNARAIPGRPLLPGALHADVQQVREPGVPGRLHDRHRSRRAAAGARRPRDRVGARRRCTAAVPARHAPRACSDRATRWRALTRGDDPAAIAASWGAAEARWRLLRAKYLLYR